MEKGKLKYILTWAGRFLMFASFVFIIRKFSAYNIEINMFMSPFVVTGVVIASLLFGVSMLFASFVFIWFLGVISNSKIVYKRTVPIYCSSNLYKYLPGNVMHFIGRNQIATEIDGVSHLTVATATLIEVVTLCISAAFISVICVYNYSIAYIRQIDVPSYIYISIIILFLIFTMIILLCRKLFVKGIKRIAAILKTIHLSVVIKLFLSCCIRLFMLSITYFIILVTMGQSITINIVPQIIGLFVLSWLIGFIMPGAPGGLGVREVIMLAFLKDILPESVMLSSILIHRIVCILGDLLAYIMAILYTKVTIRSLK